MSNSLERIWFYDPKGFITEKNYTRFFPSKEMSFSEQLNSLLRFSIYFSVIVFIIRRDPNIFFIVIFTGVFTYLLYTVDSQNKQREKFYMDKQGLVEDKITKQVCVKPTKENPFMNVLMTDYVDNPTRKPACDIKNGKVKKQAQKYFANNLYRDVSDVYDKNASDRNYYTTPNTSIPSDQNSFAQYLYGQGPTCKQGSGNKCYSNMYRAIET